MESSRHDGGRCPLLPFAWLPASLVLAFSFGFAFVGGTGYGIVCAVVFPAAASKVGGRAETAMMRHGLSIIYDERNDQAIATYPTAHRVMAFDGASGAVTAVIDTSRMGLRYPCGIALLPDGVHYAVTGYWENLFIFERRTHRLVRDLCQYPVFFGHSHISVG